MKSSYLAFACKEESRPCQACGGSGMENENIGDGDTPSSNTCESCGGTGTED